MTNPFRRWFSSGERPSASRKAPAELETRLRALEDEAEDAEDSFRARPLNRAGDLCFQEGERQRALEYYGRAIDAFLEDHQPEAARGVAQKIIRLHPRAVRTLCTLTWLDIGTGHLADARSHLDAYVEAAGRGGREDLAVAQIEEMGRIAPGKEFRMAAAEALRRLGATEAAARVREADDAGYEAGSEALRTRCFEAAVGSNEHRRDEAVA